MEGRLKQSDDFNILGPGEGKSTLHFKLDEFGSWFFYV